MTDTLLLSQFRKASGMRGCPFCRMLLDSSHRYLRNMLHEYALAPDIHRRLALSRGLCSQHAWRLQQIELAAEGDGLGTAILYESVLRQWIADLDACLAAPSRARKSFSEVARARLAPRGACPACLHAVEDEHYILSQFVESMAESDGSGPIAGLYESSDGACLLHLVALLKLEPPEDVARRLLSAQRQNAAELAAELEQYVDGHSAHRRGELPDSVRESWIRAIQLFAGARGTEAARRATG